jgi:prolyl 4-hydroxylase
MKGGGVIRAAGGGGGGVGLMRTWLRLPVVFLSCSLFFLAGFFGSLLFTQVSGVPIRLLPLFAPL